MKHTVKIYKTKSGYLVEEHRFRVDGSAPRYADDTEAMMADYEAKTLTHAFIDKMTGEYTYGPIVGKTYMIGEVKYVGPNGDRPSHIVLNRDNGEGWPGNSNREIKRYHGWRGTSNDSAFYGRGVRKCVSYQITGARSKKIRIVYEPDQKINEQ